MATRREITVVVGESNQSALIAKQRNCTLSSQPAAQERWSGVSRNDSTAFTIFTRTQARGNNGTNRENESITTQNRRRENIECGGGTQSYLQGGPTIRGKI